MPATVRLLAPEMGGGGSAALLLLLFHLFVFAWSQAEQIVRVRESFEFASTLRNALLVSRTRRHPLLCNSNSTTGYNLCLDLDRVDVFK